MKICIITTDYEKCSQCLQIFSTYHIVADLITSNSDLASLTQQIILLNEIDYSNLIQADPAPPSAILSDYEYIVCINYPVVVSSFSPHQNLIQVDFDTEQLLFLNSVPNVVHYLPIINMYLQNQQLFVEFSDQINLQDREVRIVSPKLQSSSMKPDSILQQLRLRTTSTQQVELHEFVPVQNSPLLDQVPEFRYQGEGYIVYEQEVERYSSQLHYCEEGFIYLLVGYRILSQNAKYGFEKYFLKQGQVSNQYVKVQKEEDFLDPLQTSPLLVYNYNIAKKVPENENFTVVSVKISDEFCVVAGQNIENLYEQEKNQHTSCVVTSHPNQDKQCFLKAYEIVNKVFYPKFSTEFLEIQEQNACKVAGLIGGREGIEFLLNFMFIEVVNRFWKVHPPGDSFYKGAIRELTLLDSDQKSWQAALGLLQPSQEQSIDYASLCSLINESKIMNDDETDQILSDFKLIKQHQQALQSIINQLIFHLAVLRMRQFGIPIPIYWLSTHLSPSYSNDLMQLASALSEEIPKNLQNNITISISNCVEEGERAQPSRVQSRAFGEFYENEYVDLYKEENQFIKIKQRSCNPKLLYQCDICTVQDMIDVFDEHFGVTVSGILTTGGRMLWSGCGNEHRNIREWCQERGEGGREWVVLVVADDDGEEVPRARLWW